MKNIKNIFSALKDIGLKDKEALTYITLLTIGENPASIIAKKAGIQRSTCYLCLQELMKKGFVHQIIKNNIRYFSPVEPEYILDRLQERSWDIENKIQQLRHRLPELEKLKYPPSKASKIYCFEGKENTQKLLDDMFNTQNCIQIYTFYDELKLFLKDFPAYIEKRTHKKIPLQLIYAEDKRKIPIKNIFQSAAIKKVSPHHFFPLNIFLYDEKLAFTSFKEEFGICIENKEITKALKNTFDYIWNSL